MHHALGQDAHVLGDDEETLGALVALGRLNPDVQGHEIESI